MEHFETIGTYHAGLLRKHARIRTVDEFLKEPNIDKIKQALAGKVPPDSIDRWREIAEIFMVPKVSPKMAELLVHAGVNSVEELSYRDPVQLFYKIKELDEQTYFIVIDYPAVSDIEEWIYFSRLMNRSLKYGYDVPIIKFFPLVDTDIASEFQKYRIWTIEDLETTVSSGAFNVRRRVGMGKAEYATLLELCTLCQIDGVDVVIGKALHAAGIKSLQDIKVMDPAGLVNKIKEFVPPAKADAISIEKLAKIKEEVLKGSYSEIDDTKEVA